MSIKSLSITEWGNTMVIKPLAHLHLHYNDMRANSNNHKKNHKQSTVSYTCYIIQQLLAVVEDRQTCSSTWYTIFSGV